MAGKTLHNPYATGPREGRRIGFWRPLALFASLWAQGCAPVPSLSYDPSSGQFHDAPTRADWTADPDRLERELITAVERIEWAVLRQDRTPAALIVGGAVSPGVEGHRFTALLPDGRTALIHAWPASRSTVTLTVKVGRFGDMAEEQRLVASAKKILARPRPTIRNKRFQLPDRQ